VVLLNASRLASSAHRVGILSFGNTNCKWIRTHRCSASPIERRAPQWGISTDFGAPVEATNAALRELFAALPAGEATPLDQAAFNCGMTNAENDKFGAAENAALTAAGGQSANMPQASLDAINEAALSRRLQDLLRSTVQDLLNQRLQDYYNSPEYRAAMPQL